MSYTVQGESFNTRNAALTQLIALWVSNNGDTTVVSEIVTAMRDSDTPSQIIEEWGGSLGCLEEETDAGELSDHLKTHRADIIDAC
jgi:hypothetical protein